MHQCTTPRTGAATAAWRPKSYRVHPAVDLFPEMPRDAFEKLLIDVEKHGITEPIKLFNGELVDGRTRLRAANVLKIECPVLFLHPDEMEGRTVEDWVMSMNMHRRHLTAAQRSAIAAEYLDISSAKPEEKHLSAHRQGKNPENGAPSSVRDVLARVPRATDRAAKAAGVARDSVYRARAVKRKNAQAFKDLKSGKLSIAQAEKDQVLDGEGQPVRERFQAIFRTRRKYIEAAALLSRAKSLIKGTIGQPGAEELVQVATMVKIGAARTNLVASMPHVICPDCQGTRSTSCERCTSRMWINRLEAGAEGGAQ